MKDKQRPRRRAAGSPNKRMKLAKRPLSACGLLLMLSTMIGAEDFAAPAQPSVSCEVTRPNGVVAGSDQHETNSYSSRQLSLGPFGLWPDGTVVFKPGGPGFITPDGSLAMKFGWTRGVRGRLRIEGRRLDAPAPPLRSAIPDGYGEIGFQASSLVFSTAGCWEVTGRGGACEPDVRDEGRKDRRGSVLAHSGNRRDGAPTVRCERTKGRIFP